MTGADAAGRGVRLRPVRIVVTGIAVLTVAVYVVRWMTIAPLEIRKADYAPDHRAAVLATHLGPAAVYDYAAQTALNQADSSGSAPTLPFDYPPMAIALVAPLAAVSLNAGYWLWSGAQLLLLLSGICIAALASPLPRPRAADIIAIAVVILAAPPVYANLIEGQWLGVGAFGLGAAYALWRSGHAAWGVAVMTACLAATKPQLGIGVAVWLLAQRRPRLIVAAALAVMATVGAGLVLVGTDGFGAEWQAVALVAQERPLSVYLGIPGAVTGVGGAGKLGLVLALLGDGVALSVAALLGDRLRRGTLALEPSFAGAIAITLAVSPHLWLHDLALLAPCVAWLSGWWGRRTTSTTGTTPFPYVATAWILMGSVAAVDLSGSLPAGLDHPTAWVLLGLGIFALCRSGSPSEGTGGSAQLQSARAG